MTTKNTDELLAAKDIAAEVVNERASQLAKWGQQDHLSTFSENDRRNFAKTADHWKQINDARSELGCSTWDGILLEEVYEALCEEDYDLRRAELIQVAAVALAEIEAMDRRQSEAVSE